MSLNDTLGEQGEQVFNFLGVIYLFVAIAKICDDFFVPALERISKYLKLSPNVAGATFLAAGSSAPELFTSLSDVFGKSNNLGIGTINGSAIFNILVISAATIISVKVTRQNKTSVDYRPLIRDSVIFLISIVVFMLFSRDGIIEWYESLIMVLLYIGYIILLKYNQYETKEVIVNSSIEEASRQDPVILSDLDNQLNRCQSDSNSSSRPKLTRENNSRNIPRGNSSKALNKLIKKNWLTKVFNVIAYPIDLILKITIPEIIDSTPIKTAIIAFNMSIIWIGIATHYAVVLCNNIGIAFNINPIIMGQVIVAAGTSVPDAIGSVIVAKEGEADMAIANIIGSNIFDILLGNGLPFLLKSIIDNVNIKIHTDDIYESSGWVICSLLAFVSFFAISKWKMNIPIAVVFILIYTAFVIVSFI